MIHAVAMLTGLWLLWLLLTQHWGDPGALGVAGVAALAATALAGRLGALDQGGARFAHAPMLAFLALSRAGAVFSGAMAVARAAVAADVTLRPALVRIKTRPSSDLARAALADMISAAPGAVVVETDNDGVLVHVLNEHAIDAADLSRLEADVIAAVDGKRPA